MTNTKDEVLLGRLEEAIRLKQYGDMGFGCGEHTESVGMMQTRLDENNVSYLNETPINKDVRSDMRDPQDDCDLYWDNKNEEWRYV
jgi:hypothetical protein